MALPRFRNGLPLFNLGLPSFCDPCCEELADCAAMIDFVDNTLTSRNIECLTDANWANNLGAPANDCDCFNTLQSTTYVLPFNLKSTINDFPGGGDTTTRWEWRGGSAASPLHECPSAADPDFVIESISWYLECRNLSPATDQWHWWRDAVMSAGLDAEEHEDILNLPVTAAQLEGPFVSQGLQHLAPDAACYLLSGHVWTFSWP